MQLGCKLSIALENLVDGLLRHLLGEEADKPDDWEATYHGDGATVDRINRNVYEGYNTLVGVKYESIHNNERDLIFTEKQQKNVFVNYAIPPFESKEKGICPVIKDLFQFWANTSWAEMRFRNPNLVSSKENPSTYSNPVFGLTEERLNLIPPGALTYTSLKGALAIM